MKKSVITLIVLLLTLSSYSQNNNCTDFKIGEFRYANEEMPQKIVRTENMSIETNPNDNVIIKSAVEWTSDCEYILTYKEILNHPKDVTSVIGEKIYCKILEINGNKFKVHAKSDVMDEVLEFIKTE